MTTHLAEMPATGRVFPAWAIIGWRWISRNPAAAIAPVLIPFIFLFFLRLITPPQDFPLEVVGAMIFVSQNIGNWVLGDSASFRIHMAFQDLFVASPMTKVEYLFGIALSNLIAAVPAFVVLSLLLEWLHPVPLVGWVILAATIAVMWVLFSSIGIAISSRVRSRREIWPIGQLVFTALGMLSPLYYPLSALPPTLRSVAVFLPGTYAALVAKGGTGLVATSTATLLTDGAFLGISAAVGFAISLSLYRWRAT